MLLPVREVFYVIARYKEDVSWAKKFKKFIVQKDIHVPNVGREASSYLWYIVNNYYKLDDLVAYQFCQGRSHDHKISFFNFCCDLSGNPHHPGLLIEKFAKKIDLNIPKNLYFTVGAQFKVLGKQIKKRPLSWYENAYFASISNEFPSKDKRPGGQEAYILERLWKYIFFL